MRGSGIPEVRKKVDALDVRWAELESNSAEQALPEERSRRHGELSEWSLMNGVLSTRQTPVAIMLAATIPGTALIGWLDFESGPVAMSLLYFVPIVIAAWMSRTSAAIATSFAAGGAWMTSELVLMQHQHSIILWNGLTRLTTFLILAVVIGALRRDRDELNAMNVRLAGALELEARVARTDPLTGLPNSRSFREALDRELARSRREGGAIGIGYVDLDNFKRVNDTLGHQAGDDALRRVGDALRRSVRSEDLAARLGGDEFAILGVNPTRDGLASIGERVLSEVRLIAEDFPGSGFGCTIGFVLFMRAPEDAIAAVREADELMYEVKSGSKGRFEVRASGGSSLLT
jgi:diguanylate cyclase (GGDEF)-like protein